MKDRMWKQQHYLHNNAAELVNLMGDFDILGINKINKVEGILQLEGVRGSRRILKFNFKAKFHFSTSLRLIENRHYDRFAIAHCLLHCHLLIS